MIMKHSFLAPIIALLGAYCLVLSTANVARADYDTASTHYWTTKVNSLYVKESGDYFKLCDTSTYNYQNAYFNVAFYSLSTNSWQYRYGSNSTNGSKKGQCWTYSASKGGTYNLPENRKIRVGLRASDGSLVYHTFLNDR